MEIETLNKVLLKLDILNEGQKEIREDIKEMQKGITVLKKGQVEIREDIEDLNYSVKGAFEDILMLDKRTVRLKDKNIKIVQN